MIWLKNCSFGVKQQSLTHLMEGKNEKSNISQKLLGFLPQSLSEIS
jgi:hypothetical protein